MTESTSRPGPHEYDDSMRGAVLICLTAVLAGVVIGVVGGAFRWCLDQAERLRLDMVDWAHGLAGPNWLIPIAAAALGVQTPGEATATPDHGGLEISTGYFWCH